MKPFFRKKRKQLANNNPPATRVGKSVKYLKYAIGEIVLVVIGILIALQINNWNTQRIENKKLQTYYQNMHEEISASLKRIERDLKYVAEQKQDMKLSLHYLKSSDPDTLQMLSSALNNITEYRRNAFAFPVVEEFLDNGLLPKVQNDSLRKVLRFFSISITKAAELLDKSADDEVDDKIIPYLLPRVNIMAIESNNKMYQKYYKKHLNEKLVKEGPVTDFTQFSGDMEFWNLCALKLNTFNRQIIFHKYWKEYLQKIDTQLLLKINKPKDSEYLTQTTSK